MGEGKEGEGIIRKQREDEEGEAKGKKRKEGKGRGRAFPRFLSYNLTTVDF